VFLPDIGHGLHKKNKDVAKPMKLRISNLIYGFWYFHLYLSDFHTGISRTFLYKKYLKLDQALLLPEIVPFIGFCIMNHHEKRGNQSYYPFLFSAIKKVLPANKKR
jgi:hypothetical protein